ncbi:MAG: ChaN family lipoprotein [Bacteroidales bacterium]
MKKSIILPLSLLFAMTVYAQKPAYKLFKADGSEASYDEMIKFVSQSDVVLFGEHHNNPISHWMQLELSRDLYNQKGREIILGAEMFEADQQVLLNEYLSGSVSAGMFQSQARLWDNYTTDYKPLLDFALDHQLPFIATNIPRRYASMVADGGFEALDSLQEPAYKWIAPLPMPYDSELPGYKKMMTMMGMHREPDPNMPKAQAVKDATMAYFILQNRSANQLFIHYNGAYHSDNYEGIGWYLKEYEPTIEFSTITTVEQKELNQLDEKYHKRADFILVTPVTMTKTY